MNRSNDAQALADLLDPRVRINIARSLSGSMRGHLARMISLIRDGSCDTSTADHIGRAVALAHLFHLNGEAEKALAILDETLSSGMEGIPEEIRLIVEQNRIDASFAKGLPTSDDFERRHGQIDRRHLLGVSFGDANALIEAAASSVDGKNYDSLPVYNSWLFAAYRRFDWFRIRQGSEYLCRELIRIGQPIQAGFCAILSESEEAARLVAEHLRALNDPAALDAVVGKITETANLSRHVTAACHFLQTLGDCVPSRFVGIWLRRLRRARQLAGRTHSEAGISDLAWKATAALLPASELKEVRLVIKEVLRHPQWHVSDIARDRFFKILQGGVSVADKSACRMLIEAMAPHITAAPPGNDFRSGVRLLIAVGDRWPALKPEIRKRIYRRGVAIAHFLISIAPFLEQDINFENPIEFVKATIDHLGRQVEHLTIGAVPATGHGEIALVTKETPAGKIVVKVGSCTEELEALVGHRHKFNHFLRRDLVHSLIQSTSVTENVHSNRVGHFHLLGHLADSIDLKTAREVAGVLSQYANDHRLKGHPLYGQPEQYDPLNPFRMEFGWPQDVRAAALVALARLCNYYPRFVRQILIKLIFTAGADSNATVRRGAYHAICLAPSVARACLHLAVGGIRESDASAASSALHAVAKEASLVGKAGLVPTVLSFVENCGHLDVRVRTASAVIVRQFRAALNASNREIAGKLRLLERQMGNDVSRSVRDALLAEPDHEADYRAMRSRRALNRRPSTSEERQGKPRGREHPLCIRIALTKPSGSDQLKSGAR